MRFLRANYGDEDAQEDEDDDEPPRQNAPVVIQGDYDGQGVVQGEENDVIIQGE